jgi:hypothetical protein
MILRWAGAHAERWQPTDQELRARYRAYRRRQARGLIRLLPRDAVRPLYRRAVAANGGGSGADDPLEVLVRYCEALLPLPPYEAWKADHLSNPLAHLHELDDSAEAPCVKAPATLDARFLEHDGRRWVAYVRSYREGSVWRGFIAFQCERSTRVLRTTVIFRESTAADVRVRFLDFDEGALRAFLRSCLP